ncbi:hypothetical protein GCM10022224_072270 [Nonomuraea antimicrobica]|uniref:Uncharacterized protein n=1 Tax=Nonomuraea antimicrobica TaxID=561173 RepID=A0ABP7CXD4_9ACTN
MVLVDQSCDGPSTVDPGSHVDHLAGIVRWRAERTALMWAMMVEMAFVLGRDLAQVPLTMDEQVVEALAA